MLTLLSRLKFTKPAQCYCTFSGVAPIHSFWGKNHGTQSYMLRESVTKRQKPFSTTRTGDKAE